MNDRAGFGQDDIRASPALIGQLFRTVQALNRIYPDRPFTPDGHLVGSIGEVVAADTYGLILEKCSNEGFDAKAKGGQTVEIKLTGGTSVAVASDAQPAAGVGFLVSSVWFWQVAGFGFASAMTKTFGLSSCSTASGSPSA